MKMKIPTFQDFCENEAEISDLLLHRWICCYRFGF